MRGGGLNGPLGLTLVPGGAGDLFGITPATDGAALPFVNDGTNALDFFGG